MQKLLLGFSLTLNALLLAGGYGLHRFGLQSTRYAAGYSEERFDDLACGMSSVMVLAELGEPLRVVHHYANELRVVQGKDGNPLGVGDLPNTSASLQEIVWYYSAQGDADANYELRAVAFDGSLGLRRTYRKHVSD